jgi:asparagine synthase (glutamine-hydrolysing)
MSGVLGDDKRTLMAPKFGGRLDGYDDYWHYRRYWRDDLDDFSRMQYLDIKTYLNDDILTKVDRASMAVSLEARVPLLDHELMELVFRFPSALRNRDHELKYLFKQALRPYLSQEILYRKKKGFSVPLYAWLKEAKAGDLQPLYDTGLVEPNRFRRKNFTGADLWPFVVMGKWLHAHG